MTQEQTCSGKENAAEFYIFCSVLTFWKVLFDYLKPAFRSFQTSHLDTGKSFIKLFGYRPHLCHAGGEADFFSVVHDFSYRRNNSCSTAKAAL